MEEKAEEKISFWKRILISIKDFEKYKIFAVEKLSKSFKYFFQFALLLYWASQYKNQKPLPFAYKQ